eukprot:4234176-Amphidinium_carterae.1
MIVSDDLEVSKALHKGCNSAKPQRKTQTGHACSAQGCPCGCHSCHKFFSLARGLFTWRGLTISSAASGFSPICSVVGYVPQSRITSSHAWLPRLANPTVHCALVAEMPTPVTRRARDMTRDVNACEELGMWQVAMQCLQVALRDCHKNVPANACGEKID